MTIKTAFDKIGSAVGLVVLSPVFAAVSAVNVVHFRASPFYREERAGKDGKPFQILKFRSMHEAQDENGNTLPDTERTTRWGKFLRGTGLDEFPQLLNILKGDMSLVGPRPRGIHEDTPPEILTVKPGLTGLWQIKAIGKKEKGPTETRNTLDARYVFSRSSLLADMAILVLTVPAFYRGHDGECPGAEDSSDSSLTASQEGQDSPRWNMESYLYGDEP